VRLAVPVDQVEQGVPLVREETRVPRTSAGPNWLTALRGCAAPDRPRWVRGGARDGIVTDRDRGLAGAGDEGGDDVAGVAVKIVAGPVVAGGGPRIGVAGGDLDVSQSDARVEAGGNETVA
jgi:hypothetical protein